MLFLEQSPIFRVLIPFTLGIVVYYFGAPIHPWIQFSVLIVCSVSVGFFVSTRFRKTIRTLVALIASFTFGILACIAVHPNFNAEVRLGPPKEKQAYCFVIEANKNASAAFNKYVAFAYDSAGFRTKVLLYVGKNHALECLPSDTLFAYCQLQPTEAPKNPYQFDYQNYLSLQEIHATALLGKNTAIEKRPFVGFSVFEYTQAIRDYCFEVFDKFQFSQSDQALLAALLLGDKSELSDETIQQFSSAGAMHVLAVSGLHVGIFYLVIQFLLSFLGESTTARITRVLVQLAFLWGYALLTGLTPSVTRSATMFSFVAVGQAMQSRTSIYNSIAVSALLLLVVNPFTLFEVGFQLSYAAVLGIIAFHKPIYSWFRSSNRILDYCWNISAVSISAQLATFPLGLLYFHSFPNYFLVSNLVVINCAALILYSALALLVFGFTSHIGFTISYVIKGILYVQNLVVEFVDKLPGATLNAIHVSNFDALILYALVASLLYAMVHFSKKATYLSIALGLVFTIGLGVENWQLKQTNKLVFYSGGPNTSFEHIKGFQHSFISDSAFYANTSSLSYAVYQHWYAYNLNPPEVSYIPNNSNSIFTIADSVKVAVLKNTSTQLTDSVDYLLVDGFLPNNYIIKSSQFVKRGVLYNKPIRETRVEAIKKDLPKQVFFYKLYQNSAFEVVL